jgi:hypothetical protein
MPRIAAPQNRTPVTATPVTTTRRGEESRRDASSTSSSSSESANPFVSSFEAFNPISMWSNMIGASMSMFSPLGYGAMQGPLGY